MPEPGNKALKNKVNPNKVSVNKVLPAEKLFSSRTEQTVLKTACDFENGHSDEYEASNGMNKILPMKQENTRSTDALRNPIKQSLGASHPEDLRSAAMVHQNSTDGLIRNEISQNKTPLLKVKLPPLTVPILESTGDKTVSKILNDSGTGASGSIKHDNYDIDEQCSEHSSDTDQSIGWFPSAPEGFEGLGVTTLKSVVGPMS